MSPARAVARTPAGRVRITAQAGAVRSISFIDEPDDAAALEEACALPPAAEDLDLARAAAEQFEAYTRAERDAFDLPLGPRGSAFQRRVWELLLEIPPGKTTTYGAIAAKVGGSTFTRAVGRAVGSNPVAIVIPCHRVVGAAGSLTGYAGGLPRKRALLAHEGAGAGLFAG